MQRTSETKEQLTEHLYTIIHQNELRKAQKLQELMAELNVETDSSTEMISMGTLPPLSSFGGNEVNTLHHSPSSPKSPTQSMPSGDSVNVTTQPASSEKISSRSPQGNSTEVCEKKINDHNLNESDNILKVKESSVIKVPEDFTPSGVSEDLAKNVESQQEPESHSNNHASTSVHDSEEHSETQDSRNDKPIQPNTKELPSSWTLDSVQVKKEPD